MQTVKKKMARVDLAQNTSTGACRVLWFHLFSGQMKPSVKVFVPEGYPQKQTGQGFRVQRDNDTKHQPEFLKAKKRAFFHWSSQSPDLNQMEHAFQ